MQTISVQTTQNVFIQHQIASIGDRLLAYFLDLFIIIGYVIVLLVILMNIDVAVWVYFATMVIPIGLYNLLFEIFMNGQTPGKRAMRIQVVKMDGTEAGFGQYLLRWMIGLVDRGIIGVVAIVLSGKGQRIGDMVAGTTVIKIIEQKEITAEQVFIQPENNYRVTFHQAADLQRNDVELIQRAIEAYRDFGHTQPAMLAAEKVRSHLNVQTDLRPVDFLNTIIKDYNHLNAQ